jgi:tetratricopeptide (TPR) repeat protein
LPCSPAEPLEAAEAVCHPEQGDEADPLDVVGSLLDSNMLTIAIGVEGDARIGMLDTMRDYAAEQLVESGEAERIRQNHAACYLTLAEQAEPDLRGSDAPRWTERLQTERDNFRLALAWGRDHDVELGLRIGGSLWRFWEVHNGIVEGYQWLSTLLARPSPTAAVRAKALLGGAALGCYLAQYEPARAYAEEARSIAEELGDERQVAIALNELGVLALYEGDLGAARRLLDESLSIKRRLGEGWLTANAVGNVGVVAGYAGDYAGAYTLHAESFALCEQLGETLGMAIAGGNLAHAAMHLGRLDEALERQLESLRMFEEMGDADGSAEALERLAMVANARRDPRRAARLFGRAAVRRHEAGTSPDSFHGAEVEREIAVTRGHLREDYDAEMCSGREMSVEEAFETASAIGTPSTDSRIGA